MGQGAWARAGGGGWVASWGRGLGRVAANEDTGWERDSAGVRV